MTNVNRRGVLTPIGTLKILIIIRLEGSYFGAWSQTDRPTADARADDLASCINRCEELCAYFPNHPECKMQTARCVLRCKGAKDPH